MLSGKSCKPFYYATLLGRLVICGRPCLCGDMTEYAKLSRSISRLDILFDENVGPRTWGTGLEGLTPVAVNHDAAMMTAEAAEGRIILTPKLSSW
jgi:hypothetical protein